LNVTTKFDTTTSHETTTLALDNAEDVRLNKEHFYSVMDGIANELDDPDPAGGEVQSILIVIVKKTNGLH